MFSYEHQQYLKKEKRNNYLILITQFFIFFFLIILWQLLVHFNLINSFIFSSPYNVLKTIINLYQQNYLFNHIIITIWETIISFSLSFIIGTLIATLMWWHNFIARIIEPYLTILNSLPKIALGPILIIWVGANAKSIIVMALLITVIITIINVYSGFINTDENKIKLMQSFKATKTQIYTKLILPNNIPVFINVLKLNISMSLIGVVMGELLVSKQGLGYLIMYGSQVFNLNLVITSIFLLSIISALMYYLITYIEKQLLKYQ